MSSFIKVKNLTYSYDGFTALDGVGFEIERGEKVVLLGNNGSGKSTLLRVLAGLYSAKGEYFFDGVRVNKKSFKSLRKRVGILFQNPDSMIFNPSVYDEIAFSLREFGFSDIDERVKKIAKEFCIEHLLNKSPLELSGGEKQKMMLASILVYEPDFLILDEPTSAMDPRTTGWFIDLMCELNITSLVATHDLSLAYELSNRAIVMSEEHKIIYDGDMDKLMEDVELLLRANLIYKSKCKKRNFFDSVYHKHF
ncbi:MAG: ABC transporter ATP-binding protein [Epsilonproteobacteria bacterium]|nr:ABC transporter ATP-binding protein [Campylobacterota bacterium]